MHVDEDFAEAPVGIFARVQIDLMAADRRLLNIALAPVGQLLALAHHLMHHALDDALGDGRRARRRIGGDDLLGDFLRLVVGVGDELRGERLRQLGAVAIERVGLQRELPGQEIGRLAILDRSRRWAC